MTHEYLFKIDGGYQPETLPMERLTLYMASLAKLLGEQSHVHFESVRAGSAVLAAWIEEPAVPKVRERTQSCLEGRAPKDVRDAVAELDGLLRKDNATGELSGEAGAVFIPFPGRTRPEPLVFGPFKQDGTLDGQVIRIGGKDDTLPIHLRDGPVIHTGLFTTPETARRLARHYLGATVRVQGTGHWLRSADGGWSLKSFKIVDFEVLDETPLTKIVADLRRVQGSGWGEVPDPVAELMNDRHGTAH